MPLWKQCFACHSISSISFWLCWNIALSFPQQTFFERWEFLKHRLQLWVITIVSSKFSHQLILHHFPCSHEWAIVMETNLLIIRTEKTTAVDFQTSCQSIRSMLVANVVDCKQELRTLFPCLIQAYLKLRIDPTAADKMHPSHATLFYDPLQQKGKGIRFYLKRIWHLHKVNAPSRLHFPTVCLCFSIRGKKPSLHTMKT